jgi:Cu2+-exporting ATPase
MPECSLCSLPTPEPPITDEAVDGAFCCQGCLAVDRSLDSVDSEVDETAVRERLDEASTAGISDVAPDAGATAFLTIDGMHCSTCEAFLETIATEEAGIERASASYATDLMRVEYDPAVIDETELADRLSRAGYEARPSNERADDESGDNALVRFLLGGGLFGMMVMLYYVLVLYPSYFGGVEPLVDLDGLAGHYLLAQLWVLTTIVLCYTGAPLLGGAAVSLRARQPNMDLLVSVAATAAYAYSTLAMVVGRTELYFDVTVAIVLVVTAGNYYERRVKGSVQNLVSDLAELRVEDAVRHPGGETVPVEQLEAGELVRVVPGERVPIDGTVEEGVAAVDEALVTGESTPVTKRPDDAVRGGTVVTDDPLVIRVGEDETSTVDRVVETLWSIQSATPGVQRLADRLATVFVPLVCVLATVTTVGALATGADIATAVLAGLTVLIVSCPCALGLATPLAVATGLREAAQNGIVVASAAVFESQPDVETIVFDKTGTLTSGEMRVESITAVDSAATSDTRVATDGTGVTAARARAATASASAETDPDEPRLLSLAGALEAYSGHPIADAITDCVGPGQQTVSDVTTHATGVEGRVEGDRVLVGAPSLFEREGWSVPEAVTARVEQSRGSGSIPVLVGRSGTAEGVITVADSPRQAWAEVVPELGGDRTIVVLTGDDPEATAQFRAHDAVDRVFAGVPPDGKAETVERLGADGRVAMVGDGSNDAPALAAADLGIAMGGGTQLATDAGDLVVVEDDLRTIPLAFDLLSGTRRRIRENLAWAFCYNGVAIPLALAGLLNPLFAAVAMATSSVLVVANSTRSILPGE